MFKWLGYIGVFVSIIIVITTSANPAMAQGAEKLTLEGTFLLDKTETPKPCVWNQPPSVTGKITLTLDLTKGTVTGDLVGHGSGNTIMEVPRCGNYANTYSAQVDFTGKIVGSVDRKTGMITAYATVDGKGTVKEVMAPGNYCIIGSNEATVCPYSWTITSQKVTIKGLVKNDGSANGDIICSYPGCLIRRSSWDGVMYRGMSSPSGACSTNGTWTAKGSGWGGDANPVIGNRPPVISTLTYVPAKPDTDDTVTFTVQATDPDNDELKYEWEVDGTTKSGERGTSLSVKNLTAKNHTVIVRVSDGKTTTSKPLTFPVVEAAGAGDKDNDGVADSKDMCPEEWGPTKDQGCPEFSVSVTCEPRVAAIGESVNCNAKLTGRRKDESFVWFVWRLDRSGGTGGQESSRSFTLDDEGPHYISVQAGSDLHGEVFSPDFEVKIWVPGDLSATIGVTPNPPVQGKPIIFAAKVTGQRPDESLTYAWTVDDKPHNCQTATCVLDKPPEQTFTVQVLVGGDGKNRQAKGLATISYGKLPDASSDATEAGFRITAVNCNRNITSDETLTCWAYFKRDSRDVGTLDVSWIVNGATMQKDSVTGDSCNWVLKQPAPGEKVLLVRATDPRSGQTLTLPTTVSIRPGSNAQVPPLEQTAAAGGTAAALSAWLWAEWWANRRRGSPQTAKVQATANAASTPATVPENQEQQDSRDRTKQVVDITKKPREDKPLEKQPRQRDLPDPMENLKREREHYLEAQRALRQASQDRRQAEENFEILKALHTIELASRGSDAIIEYLDLLRMIGMDLNPEAVTVDMIAKSTQALTKHLRKEFEKAYMVDLLKGSLKASLRTILVATLDKSKRPDIASQWKGTLTEPIGLKIFPRGGLKGAGTEGFIQAGEHLNKPGLKIAAKVYDYGEHIGSAYGEYMDHTEKMKLLERAKRDAQERSFIELDKEAEARGERNIAMKRIRTIADEIRRQRKPAR